MTLRIGTQADYDGATLYDLEDESANNIFVRYAGRLPEVEDDLGPKMDFNAMIKGSSRANIIAEEKIINDYFAVAANYYDDQHEDEPVFFWDSATGETARRAIIARGELIPVTEGETDVSLAWERCFYRMSVWRGSWETIDPVTIINAETMDGVTNTQALATVLGDENGRLSQLLLRATATNDEDTPLTKVFAGIRPAYGGVSLFDPVLNLEYAETIENETTVGTVNDGNTYPSGSTADNVLAVAFANDDYERRAVLSLGDVLKVVDLVVNGDFETGDLTGWTDDTAGWIVDNVHESTGTYGAYVNETDSSARIYQTAVAIPGMAYEFSYDWQVYAATGADIECYLLVSFIFLDALGAGINTDYDIRYYPDVNGSFDSVEGIIVAPATAASLRVYLTTVGVASTIEAAVDNVEIHAVAANHYRGSYTAIARAKVTEGDVDIEVRFGYTSSNQLSSIGDPYKVTNTDWKLISLGKVTFPPGRALADVNSIWRMRNLGFEIYAQRISGAPTLHLDAIILVPSEHALFIKDCSICRSSYTIDAAETEYAYADLDIRVTELEEMEPFADAADFLGINTSIELVHIAWEIPHMPGVFVCFAERADSHEIADDYVATMLYVPRYKFRNTD